MSCRPNATRLQYALIRLLSSAGIALPQVGLTSIRHGDGQLHTCTWCTMHELHFDSPLADPYPSVQVAFLVQKSQRCTE